MQNDCSNRLVRRTFLAAVAAGSLAPALADATPAPSDEADLYPRVSHGLVLSGGGAKGAYEAGIIEALAEGLADGQPLAPYGGVAGTSIGALNGWFVATGQYSMMRRLWMGAAQERIFRLKPQFAKIPEAGAGLGDRLDQLLHVVFGINKNVQGLCESQPALAWVRTYIDPRAPILMPFAWAVTNLTHGRPEYFYRLPARVSAAARDAVLDAFAFTLGRSTVIREAHDEILHHAIFASACLPFVFDPIELPAPDGHGMDVYCDGGVAANTPLAFARTVAHKVDVVMLSEPFENHTYTNAVDIGFGLYDTMQRNILESQIRSTYFETLHKRAFFELPERDIRAMQRLSPVAFAQLRRTMASISDSAVAFLQPLEKLPVDTTTFDDQKKIVQAYEMGMRDAKRGFKPYEPTDEIT